MGLTCGTSQCMDSEEGRKAWLPYASHHSCAVKSNLLPFIRREALPFDANKTAVLGNHVLRNLPRVTECECLL